MLLINVSDYLIILNDFLKNMLYNNTINVDGGIYMNKRGFTLVELLAVITILGVIATIAVISITNYRGDVNEKEIKVLRNNIISAFDMYRIDNTVNDNNLVQISFLTKTKFTYNEEKCSDISNSTIKYVVKESSKEEVYCIKFYCNGNLTINDYETNPTYCN